MSQQATLTTAPAGMDLTKVSKPFPGWTPDATGYELALLPRLGKTYGQDPFRQELVLERRRRRRADGRGYDIVPVFITTRDRYLKVARRYPQCAGLQSGVVREGDDLEFDIEACRLRSYKGSNRQPNERDARRVRPTTRWRIGAFSAGQGSSKSGAVSDGTWTST